MTAQRRAGAVDVMIALHACDVATDCAIHMRHSLRRLEYHVARRAATNRSACRSRAGAPAMLQYGLHLGQQAEMVTDSLRALFLSLWL